MRKQDVVTLIADTLQVTQAEAERALTGVISAFEVVFQQDSPLILPGFGTLSVRQRSARVGRNPRTGESMTFPASRVPHFKASAPLKARMNAGASEGVEK